MKNASFTLLMLMVLFLGISTQAQTKKWTLKECVDYALQNNISIKRILKDKFLAEYDEAGQYVDTRRTRDLDIKEMSQFIDNCVNLLADYGGYLSASEYEEYQCQKL